MLPKDTDEFTGPVADNDRPMRMEPIPDEAVPGAVQQADQQGQAAALDAMAGALPPPIEPLEPALVNALSETAARVVDQLSGGQAQMPPIPPLEQPGELPVELAPVLGVFQAFGEQAGMPLEIEDMVVDNQGLKQLTVALDQLGQSPEALQAAKAPPAAAPEPAAPPAPPERDRDALLGAP